MYGDSYKGTDMNDVIGVYVDLVEGRLFFSKNNTVYDIAYEGLYLLNQSFYPACCCLT